MEGFADGHLTPLVGTATQLVVGKLTSGSIVKTVLSGSPRE